MGDIDYRSLLKRYILRMTLEKDGFVPDNSILPDIEQFNYSMEEYEELNRCTKEIQTEWNCNAAEMSRKIEEYYLNQDLPDWLPPSIDDIDQQSRNI